jgi:cell division protein ZapA (FtsZ GTPase activity inhibitor)
MSTQNLPKKYRVSIFGELYTFISDEPEERLLSAAHHVDELMRCIAEKSGLADTKRIAVLASLQIACKLKDKEVKLDYAEQKGRELVQQIDQQLAYLELA